MLRTALLLLVAMAAAAADREPSAAQKHFTEAQAALDAATQELGKATREARADIIRNLDLTPIPTGLSANPTAAELQAAQGVVMFNDRMKSYRDMKPENRHPDDAFLKEYAQRRGTPWIVDVMQAWDRLPMSAKK